jgi:hypothetical protein
VQLAGRVAGTTLIWLLRGEMTRTLDDGIRFVGFSCLTLDAISRASTGSRDIAP